MSYLNFNDSDISDYEYDDYYDNDDLYDKEFEQLCFLHSNIKQYCYDNFLYFFDKLTLSDLWDLKDDIYIFSEVKKKYFISNRIQKLIQTFNK